MAVPARVIEEIDGGVTSLSSFWIVPVADAVAKVALTGLERATMKVSLGSAVVSPATATVKVLLVSPAAKVRVPLLAV